MRSWWKGIVIGKEKEIQPLRRLRNFHGEKRDRFHSLALHEEVLRGLVARKGIQDANPFQKQAIPMLQNGKDTIIGAETGSGKTLTYLAPLLSRIHTYPLPLDEIRNPVGIVFVPSRELAKQVWDDVALLSPAITQSTGMLVGKNYIQPRNLALLIASPTAFLKETRRKEMMSSQMVVFDEADMLLGGGYERDVKHIIGNLKNNGVVDPKANSLIRRVGNAADFDDLGDEIISATTKQEQRQFVFIAATIPDMGRKSIKNWLNYKFPHAQKILSEGFHKPVGTLQQTFISVEDSIKNIEQKPFTKDTIFDVKVDLLLQSLSRNSTEDKATLVFVNTHATAQKLRVVLKNFGFDCSCVHKGISDEERSDVLSQLRDGGIRLLICTDVAARGLDTLRVGHVVQFEFARDVVSHLHRIGRTARANTPGLVTNLVTLENSLLVETIQAAGQDSLASSFSRRRGLRKKFKRSQNVEEISSILKE